jgi:hypothetical protein
MDGSVLTQEMSVDDVLAGERSVLRSEVEYETTERLGALLVLLAPFGFAGWVGIGFAVSGAVI